MAYTLVPTELIVDGAVTSAKLDTNISISGTLGVTGELTLATHMNMGDNDKIKIGTGGDLEIYHDGSNSYISNSTGNIYLGDTNGSVHIQAKLNEESIVCTADGAVTLYHNNAVKLATTSTGIKISGVANTDDTKIYMMEDSNNGAFIKYDGSTNEGELGGLTSSGENTVMTWSRSASEVVFNENSLDMDFRVESNGNVNMLFVDGGNNAVGIGTDNPAAGLHIDSPDDSQITAILDTDNSAVKLVFRNSTETGNNIQIGADGSDLVALTNATERMRIRETGAIEIKGSSTTSQAQAYITNDNSVLTIGSSVSGSVVKDIAFNSPSTMMYIDGSTANVGIGVSPSAKLEVQDANGVSLKFGDLASYPNNVVPCFIGTATSALAGVNGDLVLVPRTSDAGKIIFATGNGGAATEKVRIANDGKVGIGCSPSNKLDIVDSTAGFGARITNNQDSSQGLQVRTSDNDTGLYILDLQSSTSATGTNYSSKFVVEKAGNVGIGTSSPLTKTTIATTSGNTALTFQQTNNSTTNFLIGCQYNVGNAFEITPSTAAGGSTFSSPALVVNSSGQVGINCTDQSNPLTVDVNSASTTADSISVRNRGVASGNHTTGLRFQFSTAVPSAIRSRLINTSNGAGTLSFYTSSNGSAGNLTERMTIDSGGAVHIGTTAQPGGGWDAHLNVAHDNNAAYFRSTGSGGSAGVGIQTGTYTSTTYALVFYNGQQGGAGGVSLANGNASTSVTYNTSSDYRMKENIRPIENGLDRLKQLKPVKFDWKTNDETSEGFIAHEVQEIFPDAIAGEKDGEEMQGMDYGRITPLLVKAIQEQQTIIDDLKSRIETLEG